MPNVRALDHIAIVTDDLEATQRFYEESLGLKASHIEVMEDRGIKVAFLPIGDTRIELIAPIREDSEVSAYLAKRGGGLHHLAFRVDDVDKDVAALEDAGVRMAQKASPGAHNCRVAFLHPKATGGVLLELSTPQDKV